MRPFLLLLLAASPLLAQTPGFNYDEAKVLPYTLPDPLVFASGQPVKTAADWPRRRAEILNLFATQVYGITPPLKHKIRTELLDLDRHALNNTAIRKQIRVFFGPSSTDPAMDLLLYLPANIKGPVPVFLGLNFGGNHTVHADPAIRVTKSWVASKANSNQASEKDRGAAASRWSIDLALSRGYGVATAYYGDIEPDADTGFTQGIRTLYGKPGPADWGSLGAWAWGLSRAMDALEQDKDVDAKRVVLHGHSRLGKATLWAGAQDPRFAIVISNDSGEGGAALARRNFGETTARINSSFPHWFAGKYKQYSGHEDLLPVDSHLLIALIAPRPVYVNSAAEDLWADPQGEFLGALNASPVYQLLGLPGLGIAKFPAIHQPSLDGAIGYHVRAGKHDVTEYDWLQWLAFADRHLPRKK